MEGESRTHGIPDSIVLKRNTKGELAWDIKCYFSVEAAPEEKVEKVDAIHKVALERWG